ncbi:hypothetical protein FS837_007199 [Tulasnella sp. UAMH 9824]|nr:hypothetical protein FS837_007199 [Tulasnella sp. UAMH 9824]
MGDLLSYEVQEVQRSPNSNPYGIQRTPDGYEHPHHSRAKSLNSLSTVSATVRGHNNLSVIGTAEEIDLMVRQSMASRGQPISVAMIDPADVPPVPPLPEHLEHSSPEHEYTTPAIFEPPQVESKWTGDAGGIPLVAESPSPISYSNSPLPPPPISSSAHTAPRSSIRSVPNRFRGPYSEHSDHIEMPEPSRSSHPITPVHNIIQQPLAPIQNIIPEPLQPLQPQESHHPESIEIEDVHVEENKVYRSSTGKSTVPTIRSRTYQRALTQPTRITDPMPRFNPMMLAPPKPRLPSVHRSFISSIRVEETGGMALIEARRALYGSHRRAPKRFFWNLLPQHDERVVQGLARLERTPDSVANLGFVKFLETRSRGALMVNLNYISESDADFPAADWITFAQAQKTYDYTLQESIATYDPAVKTLVFVFLLSRTKNSLAIWRRQFPVPESTRQAYGSLFQEVKNELAGKELLVHVEATPNNPHGTRSDIGRQPSRRPTSRRTAPPAPPGPTGPLIFNYQTTEVKTPEQLEVLPMPNAQTATITGTTVHEFGPGGRKSSVVHVFGRTPSNQGLSPVYEEEEPPKKKGWFKRMFGGPKPKSKTMDETTMPRSRGALRKNTRRKGNTLTHVEWD